MRFVSRLLLSVLLAGTVAGSPAHAFRMIKSTVIGTVVAGDKVKCDDSGGFAHWTVRGITWHLNPALNGAGAGPGVDAGLDEWNNVSGTDYNLTRGGDTTAGFTTDGTNTFVWSAGNGCTGNCLGLTALTLTAGQVIVETDITFNNSVNWTLSETDFDIRGVAAHELGHSLGIHHTNSALRFNRPTMREFYIKDWHSIENDDEDALRCSVDKFPVTCSNPCPSGGVFDGANCYMWSVPGNSPFIFNGSFYHKPLAHPGGKCPHLVWNMLTNTSTQPVFDGANCFIASANGGPNPFLLNNNYYISKSSGANPCPFGGTFDGANCYMFTWPGVTPFVFDGNMYYKTVSHPSGPCPHKAFNNTSGASIQPVFDTVNCLVQAGPGGSQVPFIWDNNYYLTPTCTP